MASFVMGAAASCSSYYKKAFLVSMQLLLLLQVVVGGAGAQVSCGDVSQALAPCLSYLTKGTPEPTSSSSCCNGARELSTLASSQPARQDICKCLEKLASQVQPLAPSVSSLPGICNVAFPYSFSPNQDCSKIT